MQETTKNNSCQSAQTRTKKSPKMLKNLVIPSREYYETPVDITPQKVSSELISKESTGSAQTQPKDYSDFGPRKGEQGSKSDASVFNKSDICQTKHYFNDKVAMEAAKKQVSFVKPKTDGKAKPQFSSYVAKKPVARPRELAFKSYVTREAWKAVVTKPTVFKKNRGSELFSGGLPNYFSSSRLGGADSIKASRIFQKSTTSDKKAVPMKSEAIETLLKDEEFLSGFLAAFHDEEDLTDLFSRYLVWVDTADFEGLLDSLAGSPSKGLFKVALIYERMSFYIFSFIYARDFRKEEIIFLKKTTVHIYLNFVALTHELAAHLPDVHSPDGPGPGPAEHRPQPLPLPHQRSRKFRRKKQRQHSEDHRRPGADPGQGAFQLLLQN